MPFDSAQAAERVELLVPGMTCAGCMRKVESCLAAAPGVRSARANLTAHRVAVEIDRTRTGAEDLVKHLADVGYDARPFDPSLHGAAQADQSGRDLLMRMGVAGFAAMNVMLLSISVWSGAEAATRDLLHWVSALIALPAMAYSGVPFYRNAIQALSAGRLNMDVPITLAIALAAIGSLIETSQSGAHAYFDAGVMLIFFLLIGRYLEHITRSRARSAAAELAALTGRAALQVREDGRRTLCAVEELTTGMVIEIAPGERIPADGVIEMGATDIDRALVTGESAPVAVAEGEAVHAGMLNLTGSVHLRITATGDETLLAEIARMVDAAERGRGVYDRLADRAARIYAPGVHVLAFIAFAVWMWWTADWQVALGIATAVLIITCPCALALAVPTVHTVASGRLFREGIFLKDGAELERLAEIDMVAFDKTGTLTDGVPRLVNAPARDDPAWPVAAALAGRSRHPLSQALAREAEARGIVPADVTDVREHPGLGVEATIGGRTARLGRPEWIGGQDHDVLVQLPDGSTAGFSFEENLRPQATETCRMLRDLGLKLSVLSGDGAAAVDRIASLTGIERRHAKLMPGDKLALLEAWHRQGRKVLMVGDGLNDSPALAAAHASISPASASDVSKTAAGLVFTRPGLDAVVTAVSVARAARRRALESFGIAACYNAIAIPVAMAGLVTPLIAALAMSGSSLLVILNALRLRSAK